MVACSNGYALLVQNNARILVVNTIQNKGNDANFMFSLPNDAQSVQLTQLLGGVLE